MKTYVSTLVKNEATLLENVLKFWSNYPVDKFLFWDDNSTDDSVDVIKHYLGNRCQVYKSDTSTLNEGKGRNFLADVAKQDSADILFSLDCDELLGKSLLDNFDDCCKAALRYNLCVFQANVVKDTLKKIRKDPAYANNYRRFITPVKYMQPLPVSEEGIHRSEREPAIFGLPAAVVDDICFIHLQAINTKFYALKQVFYKIDQLRNNPNTGRIIINNIDQACNNLNFCEVDTPFHYIGDWEFDSKIFDKILQERKYKEYILGFIEETGNKQFCSIALKYLYE